MASRSNQAFQAEGWECGLWAARWVEQALRKLRQEGHQAPPSIPETQKRVNTFIEKLTLARAEKDDKDARDKAKAAAAKEHEDRSIFETLAKNPEPVHATFEDAQAAAENCKKCFRTKRGTKGCRACMGEHFERIRWRANSSFWHMKRFAESQEKIEIE